jgi:TPR repeat protein
MKTKLKITLLFFLLTMFLITLIGCNNRNTNVSENDETITDLIPKAQNGDAEAQCNLGACYYHGKGVPKDFTEAVKWFRKAAEQGHAVAQFMLGVCYIEGGFPEDPVEQVKWIRMIAERENAESQYAYALGNCYLKGYGVFQDSVEAAKWFHKAAEQGHEEAIKVMRELNVE